MQIHRPGVGRHLHHGNRWVPRCLLLGKALTRDYRDEFCHHEEGTANHGPPSNTEKSWHDLTEFDRAFADGITYRD